MINAMTLILLLRRATARCCLDLVTVKRVCSPAYVDACSKYIRTLLNIATTRFTGCVQYYRNGPEWAELPESTTEVWLCPGFPIGTIGNFTNGTIGNNGTIGLPLEPLALPLVPMVLPMVPLVEP